MSTSRRKFLNNTLVAIAGGVPAVLAQRVSAHETAAAIPPVGFSLTRAAFESHLNSIFFISDGPSKVGLKLVKVTNLGSRKSAGKEAFSLLFHAEPETGLKQSTYLIEHEKLGIFSFLIVPVMAQNSRGRYYEAVVNRLFP